MSEAASTGPQRPHHRRKPRHRPRHCRGLPGQRGQGGCDLPQRIQAAGRHPRGQGRRHRRSVRRRRVHRGRGRARPRRGAGRQRRHHQGHPAAAHERGRFHLRDRHQPHRRVPRHQARLQGHDPAAQGPRGPHLLGLRPLRRAGPDQLLRLQGRTRRASPAPSPANSARAASRRTLWRRASSTPT